MTTQADYIVGRFGGTTALARALGLTPSVVQGWRDRGVVPGARLAEVLAAGRSLDPPIDPAEFFETRDGIKHAPRGEVAA